MLAGCNANYAWSYRGGAAGGAPVAPAGSASVNIATTSPTAGYVIIALGLFGFVTQSESGYSRVNANPFAAITPTEPLPALDPERRVNEQDCTKPIEDWSANLRCK